MRLLKRALEAYDENNAGEPIALKGPLSEVFSEALNVVYAKDEPCADSETPGIEPGVVDDGVQDMALESNGKKPKKKLDLKISKGAFHKWLGKKPDETITEKDIEKGLKDKDPHVKRMAMFAKNAKKWHDEAKSKDKGGKKKMGHYNYESFTGVAMEGICTSMAKAIVLESQQMDVTIMSKMAKAIIDTNAPPTDNFTTVYGVSKDDLAASDVVDVTSELSDAPENGEFILVIDACQPGDNGTTSGPKEEVEMIGQALECMVISHGGKVFKSLPQAAKYLFYK